MATWFLNILSLSVVVAVVCFSVRRILLLVAALLLRRPVAAYPAYLPSVTLVVPAHNEAPGIDRLLDALGVLDYPPERLFVVLVNDCSTDATGERLARWARSRPRALALDFARQAGKSQASNQAIAAASVSDVVVVCDADLRPRPDCLRRLAAAFADEAVGAAVHSTHACDGRSLFTRQSRGKFETVLVD